MEGVLSRLKHPILIRGIRRRLHAYIPQLVNLIAGESKNVNHRNLRLVRSVRHARVHPHQVAFSQHALHFKSGVRKSFGSVSHASFQ